MTWPGVRGRWSYVEGRHSQDRGLEENSSEVTLSLVFFSRGAAGRSPGWVSGAEVVSGLVEF